MMETYMYSTREMSTEWVYTFGLLSRWSSFGFTVTGFLEGQTVGGEGGRDVVGKMETEKREVRE